MDTSKRFFTGEHNEHALPHVHFNVFNEETETGSNLEFRIELILVCSKQFVSYLVLEQLSGDNNTLLRD